MGDPLGGRASCSQHERHKVNLCAQPLFRAPHPNQHTALQPLNNHRFTLEALKLQTGSKLSDKGGVGMLQRAALRGNTAC